MTLHTQDVVVRKIGVEEELMLVNPATGELTGVSQQAVRAHEADSDQVTVGVRVDREESEVEQELFLQQIEASTSPVESVSELMDEIRRGRKAVATAAEAAGAAAAPHRNTSGAACVFSRPVAAAVPRCTRSNDTRGDPDRTWHLDVCSGAPPSPWHA